MGHVPCGGHQIVIRPSEAEAQVRAHERAIEEVLNPDLCVKIAPPPTAADPHERNLAWIRR